MKTDNNAYDVVAMDGGGAALRATLVLGRSHPLRKPLSALGGRILAKQDRSGRTGAFGFVHCLICLGYKHVDIEKLG